LLERYARTHGPFVAAAAAERFGLGVDPVVDVLNRLEQSGRLLKGEFLPDGHGVEWCHPDNLRAIKQRSLARLRKQVEPVEAAGFSRFLLDWQGVTRPRRGVEGLLGVLEQLQGVPLVASDLETRILPARVAAYRPGLLDELCAAGEVVWCGRGTLGQNDGRISLYRRAHFARLATQTDDVEDGLAARVLELLSQRGALFFDDIAGELGTFPADVLEALWKLVWAGHVTNDTLAPMRSRIRPPRTSRKRRTRGGSRFRGAGPAGSEGRWSLLFRAPERHSPTDRRTAIAQQLLERHGVLTREAVHSEGLEGGFSAVYPVLRAMEEAGRVRRGYFVAGLGATQFAVPGADDRLRLVANGDDDETPDAFTLAATDPANAYGAAIPWPERPGARPQRAAGATVVLHEGRLVAFVARNETNVATFLPEAEPARGQAARAVVSALTRPLETGPLRAVLIEAVDGLAPDESVLARFLEDAGFEMTAGGALRRRRTRSG
jgi:ATP-dependent Lhr-like helicase